MFHSLVMIKKKQKKTKNKNYTQHAVHTLARRIYSIFFN